VAVAIWTARWQAQNYRGNSGVHPPDGGRESRLGCSQNTGRASKARLGRFGTNRSSNLKRVRHSGDAGKRCLSFLQNHREVILALDFFTVPTVTFKLLYCFFVIEHGRRRILHFNLARHPTAEWVVHQLRETLPEAGPYRYVILDRDSKSDAESSPSCNQRV
jgi:hypothetical protein